MGDSDLEAIKENLQCPICDNYMCAPIRQCATGHSICELCFGKIKRCPKCRGPKSEARCYTLEAIASRLILSCRFKSEGCTFSSKGEDLVNHEKYCHYAPINCPFRTYDNCNWVGYISRLKHHCLKKHRNNFYARERQKFLAKNFNEINGYHYIYVVIQAFNEYFRLTWDLDELTGITKWGIYYMGAESNARKFSFKIEFPKEADKEYDDISRNLTWKAPCSSLPSDDMIKFPGPNFLIVNRGLLLTYCEPNGDLNYSVTIYRSNFCQSDQEEQSTLKSEPPCGCPDDRKENKDQE